MAQPEVIAETDGTFFEVLSNKQVSIQVIDTGLTWEETGETTSVLGFLPSSEILAADFSLPEKNGDRNADYVTVHYVEVVTCPGKNVLLRKTSVSFQGVRSDCHNIAAAIREIVNKNESHRPRSLLVFINPMSGRHNAVSTYQKVAKPLFVLCNIRVHKIVTKYGKEPIEVLDTYDLSTIDGVVNMGGDGSLNQVLTGLLTRAAKDANVDMEKRATTVIKPPVPLGLVPMGTANIVSMIVNASYNDAETAVLNVILGRKTAGEITTLETLDNKFMAYSLLWNSIGTLSSIAPIMERSRFLGLFRYTFIPLLKWAYFKRNQVEVQYKAVAEEEREIKQRSDDIMKESDHSTTVDGPDPGWKTYKGLITDVTITPRATCGGLYQTIIAKQQPPYTKPCFMYNKWFLMLEKFQNVTQAMGYWGKDTMEMRQNTPIEEIEHIEFTELRVKASGHWTGNNILCLDGDAVPTPYFDYHVRVVSDALDLFCIDDALVTSHIELTPQNS